MNYSVENFASYTLPKLISWFNEQTSGNRVIVAPVKLFRVKLVEYNGVSSVVVDGVAPSDAFYIGESVFLYTGAVGIPVIVGVYDFFEISKTVMPQGTDVVASITKYSEDKEAANE